MTQEERDFLNSYSIADYDRPSVAADIVLFALAQNKENSRKVGVGALQILLIQRANYPEKGKWSLPGAFCIPAESVEETARRALFDETGIRDAYLKLNGIYTSPKRDPRGWIMSDAFIGTCDKKACVLRSGEGAWKALWFDIKMRTEREENTPGIGSASVARHILTLENAEEKIVLTAEAEETSTFNGTRTYHSTEVISSDLGFDHGEIIINAMQSLRTGVENDVRLAFELLPAEFTVGEIQAAYSRIFDIPESVPNFRRKIESYIIETESVEKGRGYRPAKKYRRNPKMF